MKKLLIITVLFTIVFLHSVTFAYPLSLKVGAGSGPVFFEGDHKQNFQGMGGLKFYLPYSCLTVEGLTETIKDGDGWIWGGNVRPGLRLGQNISPYALFGLRDGENFAVGGGLEIGVFPFKYSEWERENSIASEVEKTFYHMINLDFRYEMEDMDEITLHKVMFFISFEAPIWLLAR